MNIEVNHIKWSIYNGALVPDAPPHVEVNLSREQAKEILRKSKAYFLRWPSDYDCGFETEWWYVIKDKSYKLDELSSKRRLEIKKGIKRCIVKRVDAEYIAKNCYEVYKRAFNSYDTFQKPMGQEEFYNSMMSKKGNQVFDFWVALSKTDSKAIGYFMNRVGADCCIYSSGKFDPDYLNDNIHHALVYEMTNYYINELGLKYVCAGARSINHKTKIQDFLIHKLLFRKAFCKLNVIYNPIIRIMALVLYPFRDIISKINTNFCNKIIVLLRQEKIRRSFSPRK